MKTTILALLLILASVGAFFLTVRAMYQLRQMDLLTKNYWKENGLKTVLLSIIWLLLLVCSIGLLIGTAWAIKGLKITLGLFWIAGFLTWIWQFIGGIMVLAFNKPLNFSETMKHAPWTQEMLEKTMRPLKELTDAEGSVEDMLEKTTEEPDEEGNEDWFEASTKREVGKQLIGKTIGFFVLTGILFMVWMILN
ncbi:MAG: hypothetical protein AAGJ18_10735 [Bacteroidota bacterium]